jgi:hypothetical protein
MADYKSKFSEQGAKRNIESAQKAIALVYKIVKNSKSSGGKI